MRGNNLLWPNLFLFWCMLCEVMPGILLAIRPDDSPDSP